MCGIVGYVGPKQALDVLVPGLEGLEYRGYDSAGVALIGTDGLAVTKTAGRMADLVKALQEEPARSASATPDGRPTVHQRRATPIRTGTVTPPLRSSTMASSRTGRCCGRS
jgi:glucosamine--fructose-6-phosphate aminotransferase (isomerizing)